MSPEEQQKLCNAIESAHKIEAVSDRTEQNTPQTRITAATCPVANFPSSSTTTSTSSCFYQNAVREYHKEVIHSSSVPGSVENSSVGSSKTEKRCMVCAGKASGVHYLVWSCSSCKTFFRRTIMDNRRYSCKKLGNCLIDEQTRCACRHCRFQKCFQVGMKFTEIEIDRKRRIIREISDSSTDLEERIQSEKDPLVRDLLAKEAKFQVLLHSQLVTVYGSLEEALGAKQCAFLMNNLEEHKRNRVEQYDSQLTFYDWRARILSITIDWIKSFAIFQEFPPLDTQVLVTHSAFVLLAFSEAFHTPERYSDRLVYPDGLQVTRNTTGDGMGFGRAMVSIINDILSPIRRIHLTDVEYIFIQTLLLFDPDCLALSEQGLLLVTQERDRYLGSMRNYLAEHANSGQLEAVTRLAELLMLISKIQKVAKFKREFICANDEQRCRGFSEFGESLLAIQLAKQYAATSFF